ncbi:MAG: nitroreductase family protein [Candidatus Omnitrophica bacterium]|nr:nitroreductase family protein [Candidatus Omnitrophota bacterium]
MQTYQAIKKRYSCRKFIKKSIPKDLIEKLVDAGRLAPTARNIQPWEFVVITEEDKLKEIASIVETGRFIGEASCCIAVFCKDTKYYLEDGSAATENILILATDLGLGSCWVAGDKKPYSEQIRDILGVPQEFKLVSLIALGYPAEEKPFLEKRRLNELIHWEKF